MSPVSLPAWAEEMRAIFRAQTIGQFVLYGNIKDLVEDRRDASVSYLPLKRYLAEVLFEPFDVVLFYDRGKGIRIARGAEHFHAFLQSFDRFNSTRFASDAGLSSASAAGAAGARSLELPGLLPRAPEQALELIDRFLGATQNTGRSVAVVLDYAHSIVPRGETASLAGAVGANLIKISTWAEDPGITGANVVTVLLTENLLDLAAAIVDSPYSAKIAIPLPDRPAVSAYVASLAAAEPDFAGLCDVSGEALADRLLGLSRIHLKALLLRALRNKERISGEYLARIRKETIEKEASERVEFIESRRTLDDVAGHAEAKAWLRDDARLLKKGARNALPMGYLVTGRIGTGKTYLIECFAGECGVPFVALKNFRDKWVGTTEGNLEKIFSILHSLGQVVVFVDEADQFAGKRGGGDGDSGLSGRIYGMLAREMADTRNRGRILWIFATSRPDLLEVDLKRQGRLDVHIPLFPPEDEEGKRELFRAMARKLGLKLAADEVPSLPFTAPISGNEIEGLLVRAVRRYELQEDGKEGLALKEIIARVVEEFRPSAHTTELELMDLLAVRECTDDRFLPARFRDLDVARVETRIRELEGRR